MAARSYIENGKPRYASRVLVKAWSAQPHPDLAAAFAEIAPDETPAERLKRFRALTKYREGDPETRMLVTELNIAAEDFPAARAALGGLPDELPSQRALTLLAAIERGEGAEDRVVRALLARAVTAPRGPQWVCENCNHAHAAWTPVCDGCDGFDTVAWKPAPETQGAMQGGAEMLPLIVGTPEDVAEEDDAEDGVVEAEIIEADADPKDDDKPSPA